MAEKYWKVSYGFPGTWSGCEEFTSEEAARAWYETHCENPPMRGGVKAKVVTLYDKEGNYIAGFAAGGRYGKVQ